MRQGEPGTSFYLVAGGELRVSVASRRRHARASWRACTRTACSGEMALHHQPAAGRHGGGGAGRPTVLEVTRRGAGPGARPDARRCSRRWIASRASGLIQNLLATSPLFTPFTKDQQAELLRRFEGVEVDPGRGDHPPGRRRDRVCTWCCRATLEVAPRPARAQPDEPVPAGGGWPTGDIFGEMSLIANQPTLATVRARPAAPCCSWPGCYVERLAAAFPEVHGYFAEVAARRAEDNSLRLGAAHAAARTDRARRQRHAAAVTAGRGRTWAKQQESCVVSPAIPLTPQEGAG